MHVFEERRCTLSASFERIETGFPRSESSNVIGAFITAALSAVLRVSNTWNKITKAVTQGLERRREELEHETVHGMTCSIKQTSRG
jgi:hypothetical protein